MKIWGYVVLAGMAIGALTWAYNAVYAHGYDTRSLEINKAHQEAVETLTAENNRLQSADNIRVETIVRTEIQIKEKIKYVERQISEVDNAQCRRLSADWVRIYNTSANSGRTGPGANLSVPEDPVPVSIDN